MSVWNNLPESVFVVKLFIRCFLFVLAYAFTGTAVFRNQPSRRFSPEPSAITPSTSPHPHSSASWPPQSLQPVLFHGVADLHKRLGIFRRSCINVPTSGDVTKRLLLLRCDPQPLYFFPAVSFSPAWLLLSLVTPFAPPIISAIGRPAPDGTPLICTCTGAAFPCSMAILIPSAS